MGAWDKPQAEQEFLRALELNPRYIQARAWYAVFYLQFSAGRLAEGMAQAKLALEADPLSGYAHAIYAFSCSMAGQHAKGAQTARRAVEIDSESYLTCMILQSVLLLSRDFEDSVAAGELALMKSGRTSWSLAGVGCALADWGKVADAEAIYAEMLARARRQYMPPTYLALLAAYLSRENDLIVYSREAFAIRDPSCQFHFSRYWPPSERLYAYPRFRDLLSEVGFE